MNYSWALIPLMSAFIGWFTNRIAVKMLFHPRRPKRILGIVFHGIFPKKRQQFAGKLGKLVSSELLSFRDIEQQITLPENMQKIMPMAEVHIDHFLRHRLVAEMPVIGMFIGDKTITQLKTLFLSELESLFPLIMKEYMHHLQQDLDLEKIVTEKLAGFPLDKLEHLLYTTLSKEFRLVGILGGILGFLIGLIQVLISFIH
ncbi:MAG: DUF445 family protein [Sediminibacterium sp.]